MTPEQIAKAALDRRLREAVVLTRSYYSEAMDDIRRDLSRVYERYSVNGVLTHAEMSKYNRLRALERQLTQDLGPAFARTRSLSEKLVAVEYEEAFYRFAFSINQRVKASLTWGLLRTADIRAAIDNPLRYIAEDSIRKEGLLRIRRAVATGLIRGDSYPSMARRIRDVVLETKRDSIATRAIRIVRTEGQRAQVLGQQECYDKARDIGVDVIDVWDAVLDSRVRTDHAALDGVEAEYRDGVPYWNTAVGEVAGPLRSGVASFDVQCRCRITGKITGYEPTTIQTKEGPKSAAEYAQFRADFVRRRREAKR